MRAYLLSIFLVLFLSASAQVQNLEVGYQEFPTTISDQVADSKGNIFFTGSFTGQLKVKDTILKNGAGQSDIYLLKCDSNQNIIFYKTFGRENEETAGVLAYLNDKIYMSTNVSGSSNFNSPPADPNPLPRSIMQLDTLGTTIWVKQTNIFIQRIFADKNVIHVIGSATPMMPVYFNDVLLYNATGSGRRLNRIIHLMLDTAGNLTNFKAITPINESDQVEFANEISSFSDGKVFMALRVTGSSSFNVGNISIPLPSSKNPRLVLVKMDTSYLNVSAKIINPTVNEIYPTAMNGIPMTVSKQDSIYMIATSFSGMPETIDGITVPLNTKNVLLVFDSNLTLKRTMSLSDQRVANLYGSIKQVFLYRSINTSKDGFFITGTYVSSNAATIPNDIPQKISFSVFPNLESVIDIAGPSASFVITCSPTFNGGSFNWLGNHSEYEKESLIQRLPRTVNDRFLIYNNGVDNVWNPWKIDLKGNVIWGAMKRNADRVDIVESAQYLRDGSRIITGFASGLTKLDTSSTNIKCSDRRDFFIARISLSGETLFFKRFYSTFRDVQVKNVIVRNEKIYFLAQYSFAYNERNYLTVNNVNYPLTFFGGSLLASIDTIGNVEVMNLPNNEIANAQLQDFNFFPDGDMALVTNSILSQHVLNNMFPPANSSFIIKLNPITKQVVSARQFICTPGLILNHIEIDTSGNLYLITTNHGGTYETHSEISLHDGKKIIDRITVENNVQTTGGYSILKMTFDEFKWFKRTNSSFSAQRITDISHGSESFLVNDKLHFFGKVYSGDKFIWDNQIINQSTEQGNLYINTIDTSGAFLSQKHIPNFNLHSIRRDTVGNFLLNGTISEPILIDTVSIPFEGGLLDGLSLQLNSDLKLVRFFRISSSYYEEVRDLDIYKDSILTVAYYAQTTPTFLINRPGTQQIAITDYKPNGHLSSINIPPATYFRSRTSGDWSNKNVWEYSSDGTLWRTATRAPTSNAKKTVIQNGHVITLFSDLELNQLLIDSGGKLILKSGIHLSIK